MNDTMHLADTSSAGLDDGRLNAAVAQGILQRDQADRLIEFWAQQDQKAEAEGAVSHADLEEVRFVRGFHDIFIAIGIVIFLAGMTFGLRNLFISGAGAAITAVAIWVLSEIFAGKLRLALPSFLLSVAFTPYFLAASVQLMTAKVDDGFFGFFAFEEGELSALIVPTLVAIGGAVLHYMRFKVPVGLTGILGGVILLAAVLFENIIPGLLTTHIAWFLLIAGMSSFALAMFFDTRDLMRVTINSDKAFWLHLLAAPMIVHSLLVLVTDGRVGENASYALLVISVFLILALVAIIVDRRAILVSGLGYFGVAIGVLMTQADVSEETTLAVTLVLLGCFILLLGSAWRNVRRTLVSPFSSTALMRLVPAIN